MSQKTTNRQSNSIEKFDLVDLLQLKASKVIDLFIPITICMSFVVTSTVTVKFFTKLEESPFSGVFTEPEADFLSKISSSLAMTFVFIVTIASVSFTIIYLYKNRYYALLNAFVMTTFIILLFAIMTLYLLEVLRHFNIPTDYITFILFIWNFGVTGNLCIHWKGPQIGQQGFLIICSTLNALVFIKIFPEWTIWLLLSAIPIWDIFAVLNSRGPLRILVETAQDRNEDILPALVYTASIVYLIGMTDSPEKNVKIVINQSGKQIESISRRENFLHDYSSTDQNHRKSVESYDSNIHEITDHDQSKMTLGLGDFVFYSVLLGRTSSLGNWNTTLAVYLSILIGLTCTLILLDLTGKALPALPISLAFGLITLAMTSMIVGPFYDMLIKNQIFV